jgi:hypothetical protein
VGDCVEWLGLGGGLMDCRHILGPTFTNPPEVNMGRLERQEIIMYCRKCALCGVVVVVDSINAMKVAPDGR